MVQVHWGDPTPSKKFCLIDQERVVVADCYSREAADELIFLANYAYEKLASPLDHLERPEA